jgi:leucyl-tRNA synthetase
VMQTYLVLLSPFAPHIAEELWSKLGNSQTISAEQWPSFEERYLVADTFTYAIQVNGKVRATLELPAEESKIKDKVLDAARALPQIDRYLAEGQVVKEIFVPGKIVNFVVKA